MQRFPEAVRKRLTLGSFLSVLPALAVLWYLDGGDIGAVLIGGVGIVLAGALGVVIDSYDIDRRIFKLMFGLIILAAGVASVQDGTWPAIAFLVGGCWLVLDTVYDYRRGIERHGSTRTNMSLHEMRDFSETAQPILAELREYAKSNAELHAALDANNDEIDRVLDRLVRMGTVTKRGGAYHVNETRLGPSAFLRKIASRIARPFTITV